MAREIGLSCWPWGDQRGCDNQYSTTVRKGEKDMAANNRMHGEAGKLGWCIGHHDGQAYYVCPEHKNCVWDPMRLTA